MVNSQLTSLYSKSNTQQKPSPLGTGLVPSGIIAKGAGVTTPSNGNNVSNIEERKNSNVSGTYTMGVTTISKTQKTTDQNGAEENWETEAGESVTKDEDSEDDLEIIDEVIGAAAGPVRSGTEVIDDPVASSNYNLDPRHILLTLTNKPGGGNTSTRPLQGHVAPADSSKLIDGRRSVVVQSPSTSKDQNLAGGKMLPMRGVKRKLPQNESTKEGINEDLTPKKLKKEITVVQDSGMRLSDFAGSEKLVEV
jgi:hypothetical protein